MTYCAGSPIAASPATATYSRHRDGSAAGFPKIDARINCAPPGMATTVRNTRQVEPKSNDFCRSARIKVYVVVKTRPAAIPIAVESISLACGLRLVTQDNADNPADYRPDWPPNSRSENCPTDETNSFRRVVLRRDRNCHFIKSSTMDTVKPPRPWVRGDNIDLLAGGAADGDVHSRISLSLDVLES